jgi:hypothetical protein
MHEFRIALDIRSSSGWDVVYSVIVRGSVIRGGVTPMPSPLRGGTNRKPDCCMASKTASSLPPSPKISPSNDTNTAPTLGLEALRSVHVKMLENESTERSRQTDELHVPGRRGQCARKAQKGVVDFLLLLVNGSGSLLKVHYFLLGSRRQSHRLFFLNGCRWWWWRCGCLVLRLWPTGCLLPRHRGRSRVTEFWWNWSASVVCLLVTRKARAGYLFFLLYDRLNRHGICLLRRLQDPRRRTTR